MSGVVAFEGELNTIVREYLEFNEFEKTLSSFKRECQEKGKPFAPGTTKRQANHALVQVQNDMLQNFVGGRRMDFFLMWNEYVPKNIRNNDSVAQKLEFYLNIYFAIYPIKNNQEDKESGMNAFKTYLETRGSGLSQTTEFLPFYALPFVPNPRAHPAYKELFTDKWTPDLQSRLQKFLTLTLQSTPQPRLFELYKGGSRDVQTMQQQIMDADRKCSTYVKRYNRIQTDYHNLIGITADLVDSLEKTVQGDPVSPEYLQVICMRLFSNQVRQSVDLTRPGTAAEVLRQSVIPPQGLEKNATTPGTSLDFEKIKKDVATGPDRIKALLLQALRWKLTKSAPSERDSMMANYINCDMLGCREAGPHRNDILKLLLSDSEVVRQYIARLFNTMASLADGRSYLAQNQELMRALMGNLRSEDRDSLTRENVLGCLQKLSLRRQLQSSMIDHDIIAWLVMVLEDNDSLSDYTLEYSVALLMNLCLRSAGKHKCADSAAQVLKVLSDLLGHDNQEIIPYVNGALYSILAIPSIREEAKAMGMEEILKCFIKEGQADMNRQIEFIIKQLNSNEEPDDADSDDEDDEEDEEDQDAMEADLDKAELLKPGSGELCGDRLLNTHYVGTTSPARKKRVGDALQEELLTRPVTPSQRRGGDSPVVHVQPRSRPPSGQGSRPTSSSSRPSSRSHVHRPPTRSGSRPGSARPDSSLDELPEPPPVPTDPEASNLVAKATGSQRSLAQAVDSPSIRPSTKAREQNSREHTGVEEYSAAFSSRPRIPRTPEVGGNSATRPTSRGSIGGGSPPMPKYSDSLPTSRPNSGGRPSSSSGKKTPQSPGPRQANGSKTGSKSSSKTGSKPSSRPKSKGDNL